MAGSQRSVAFRCVVMGGAALVLIAAIFAAPAWTHGSAAPIPFGSPAFAAQWNAIEPKAPNFWGPAYQNIFPEQYQEATNGQRFVQYFDKARMEQTTAGGPVTNGLLTVELISGQRQFGDARFVAYPPAAIPIVGDVMNTFPTYASLGTGGLPAIAAKIATPNGNVYGADGTLTANSQLAAYPGSAFGSFQSDPGGKYAHNIPLAFWSYLSALPVPWQTTMGFPLTEAVWVNVALNGTPTWIMVQPFERRVLSYTPTNPAGFQVEMGNIGQHYYQWRYMTSPGGVNGPAGPTPLPVTADTATPDPCATPTPLPTPTGTPVAATATPYVTATPCSNIYATSTPEPEGVEIRNLRQIGLTDTSFSFSFETNLSATSYVRWGTESGVYPFHQEIATSPTKFHSTKLSGLQPDTPYYFTIRVTSSVDAINRYEDYFQTTGVSVPTATTGPPPTPTTVGTSAPPPTAVGTAVPVPSRIPCPPSQVCEPTAVAKTAVSLTATASNQTAVAKTVTATNQTAVAQTATKKAGGH